jgi:GT2 family glycosyltransferase
MKFAWQYNFENIMWLNNDTITNENFINDMLNTLEKYKDNLVSCRINYYPDKEYIWWM